VVQCEHVIVVFWSMTLCNLVCTNNFLVEHSVYLQPWRWRHYVPTECWYLPTSLHGVITQKMIVWCFIAVITTCLYLSVLRCPLYWQTNFRSFVVFCVLCQWFDIVRIQNNLICSICIQVCFISWTGYSVLDTRNINLNFQSVSMYKRYSKSCVC
jgi:hypothetical protein